MSNPPTSTVGVTFETGTAGKRTPVATSTPFRMLILADLSGRANRQSNAPATRKPIAIDRDDFDDVLARMQPTLQLRIGSDRAEPTTITFRELDDFHPDRLFERVELFERLRRLRRRLTNRDTFAEAAAELTAGRPEPAAPPQSPTPPQSAGTGAGGLLDAALDATDPSAAASPPSNPMEHVIREIIAPYVEPVADPREQEFVAAVDEAIAEQMRRLLHHPEFQALEAAWRGLSFLVRRLETDAKLRVQILDVSFDELAAELASSDDWSRSAIWRLLSDHSEATPGNDPFACLVGLFEVRPTEEGIATIRALAGMAERLSAPLLAGANSRFVGCEAFAESSDPADWTTSLDDATASAWSSFRASNARFASLLAPRFLLRRPYGRKSDPTESFTFEELPATPAHADHLWCPSSLLGALLLGTRFAERGWSLQCDVPFEVEGLPLHVFDADGDREQMPCAEAWLSERSGRTLIANGLTPVYSVRNSDAVLLPGLRDSADPSGPLCGAWTSMPVDGNDALRD